MVNFDFLVWLVFEYRRSFKIDSLVLWKSVIIGPAQRGPMKPAPSVSQSVRLSQKFSYFLPLDFSDFLHQASLL